MKRRNAFGTVLLTVGLVMVVAGATSNDACAQFPGGYMPNGYMPDGYLPNGYGSTGIAIPNGFGSSGIAIPGGFGSGGIAIPGGIGNGGINWSWPGADDGESGDETTETPDDEEDLEFQFFFTKEETSLPNTYPFSGSGSETSPNDMYRRAQDAIDDLFPWGVLFPWDERLPWDGRPLDPMRK